MCGKGFALPAEKSRVAARKGIPYLYVGYDDDLNRNGFNRFTGDLEPGFRRNGRTFFIKMYYLIRKSFGVVNGTHSAI
jgi:hypothetical protein